MHTAYLLGFIDTKTGAIISAGVFSENHMEITRLNNYVPCTIHSVNGTSYANAHDEMIQVIATHITWIKDLLHESEQKEVQRLINISIMEQALI